LISIEIKAKELGEEIRKTEQYKILETAGQKLKEDESAQNLIKELQEVQKQIEFAQRSGIPPNQEQGENFNAIRQKMEANSSVQEFMDAQKQFNTVMEAVNNAIGKGITGEENPQ
jgi:cell fate (sporulation/competence/biofilm development) regulator YlbF (YheA/YmcA/DUF963 family)